MSRKLVKTVRLDEIEELGGRLLSSGVIELDGIAYEQSSIISNDSEYTYNVALKYINFGIECLVVEYGGVLTLWRGLRRVNTFQGETKPLVAYVEDSPVDGALVRRILDKLGCNTVVITKPIEAIGILLRIKPCMILLDLNMPIVNGYEICAQVKRAVILKEIPVIIVTGRAGILDRARAKVVGAAEFLSKPVDESKLRMLVNKYIYGLRA